MTQKPFSEIQTISYRVLDNRIQIIQIMKENQQNYGGSIYKSACNTAISLYHFLEARYKYIDTTIRDYTDKILRYIINGDQSLFNDTELAAMNCYLRNVSTNVDEATIFLYIKTIQEEYNTQVQDLKKIEEDTMNSRNILKYAPFLLTKEILDYVKYNRTINSSTDNLMFFNEMYYWGYIAGKRSERKKRKKSSKDKD